MIKYSDEDLEKYNEEDDAEDLDKQEEDEE